MQYYGYICYICKNVTSIICMVNIIKANSEMPLWLFSKTSHLKTFITT